MEGVETVGGDDSETGLVTKKKGKQNGRPVSEPASLRTTGIKRRATIYHYYDQINSNCTYDQSTK